MIAQKVVTLLWEQIPWRKLEKYVLKLQRQIFRSQRRGQKRRVKWLQRKLINSNANILLSIRKITQKNRGKKTPGIDEFVALSNTDRIKIYEEIKKIKLNHYNPQPAKRAYIKKSNGKNRPLGIPTIIDRALQNIVKNALEPQWEEIFEPTTYGFRPKRNAHDALQRIHNDLCRGKRLYIFEGDFKSCFDNLDHDFLINRLKDFPAVTIIERWLKAGIFENGAFNETEKGTPQGAVISPLLANIALYGMQETLGITYKPKYNKTKDGKKHLTYVTQGKYRISFFADDFVIMCETEEDAEKIPEILEPYLKERGLELQQDKTKITSVFDGFDFLGFNVRGYHTKQNKHKKFKVIIKPSKKSLKAARKKIKETFDKCKGTNVEVLIEQLEPVIRGIANYWSPFCSKESYSNIDSYIWIKTKKFLKHLHPKKNWDWIRSRYFKPDATGQSKNRWILTDPEIRTRQLMKMSWTPIVRHRMIAYKSTPFDSNLIEYFQQRSIKEFDRNNVLYRRKLAKRQSYICPICGRPITDINGEYDAHHLTPKCVGGTNTYDNLWLVHHSCHVRYHQTFPPKYGRPTDNNIRAFKIVYKRELWDKKFA